MKIYTIHTVLYHVDGPGKFGDGESSMHFRHRRDAEEFARGKRYYSGPASIVTAEVPKRIAERWGVAL